MIPTRRLAYLFVGPLVLGALAIFEVAFLVPMLACDIVILLIALVDLASSRAMVDARRTVGEVQAVARPFEVSVVVDNLHRRPLSLRVTDDCPGIAEGLPAGGRVPPRGHLEVTYRCRVDRRGEHAFGALVVRWSSPFGLWERQRSIPCASAVRVYPDFAQLRSYGMQVHLEYERLPRAAVRRRGGENEFQRLRRYVRGDPYRHIDWRATARKGHFITREFGQERNQNIIFLVDAGRMMAGRLGELTAFDHALNAALMMGQVALRHGDRVGLLVFDREVRVWMPPRGGSRSGAALIRGTYDIFPRPFEPDYNLAFRHLTQNVRRRSLVVLLTSVVDEVNAVLASRVAGALRRRHVPLCVWLRDAEVEGLIVGPDIDPYHRAAAAELVQWRERSLAGLKRQGALIVDCAPSDLTASLLGKYLEIKARRLL